MNRFRDPIMRSYYDSGVHAYETRHRDLFLPSGERRRAGSYGSSFATMFWQGYDGTVFGRGWDAAGRKTVGYAVWRAGRDCRAQEARGARGASRQANVPPPRAPRLQGRKTPPAGLSCRAPRSTPSPRAVDCRHASGAPCGWRHTAADGSRGNERA